MKSTSAEARGMVLKYLTHVSEINYEQAKQCAAIEVVGILNAVTTIADKKYDYWNEVKREIELL